ncbi:hypothetical protein D915_010224 [Fasciola hepatica]|uniref:GSKIP domain-containing protein n=1 Tax=Fasciola hepatica TaxID=6192 RepID=A0A4E0RQM0_FASHE|nr:hypothetical protein D915_010224 [Fasciola hepatica]
MPTSNNSLIEESECEQLGAFESDAKLCLVEAKAAISEVAFGVKGIQAASDTLPRTDSLAYINLTTLKGESMCVEISVKGFYPIGRNRIPKGIITMRPVNTMKQSTPYCLLEVICSVISSPKGPSIDYLNWIIGNRWNCLDWINHLLY